MIKFDASGVDPRTIAERSAAVNAANLERWRGKFVVEYRDHPGSWPDGPGAWFQDEDWDASGKLVATGEARLRAIDAFANDRAAGRPCPPLGGVTTKAPKKPLVRETETRETTHPSQNGTPWEAAGVSRATWFRQKGKKEAAE